MGITGAASGWQGGTAAMSAETTAEVVERCGEWLAGWNGGTWPAFGPATEQMLDRGRNGLAEPPPRDGPGRLDRNS